VLAYLIHGHVVRRILRHLHLPELPPPLAQGPGATAAGALGVTLSYAQALGEAGVLTERFWLRHVLKDSWLPAQRLASATR